MAYKLGSLFDGSGGFPLSGALCGIKPVWAAEVEPYPIAVTRSRFPNMKHLGDISKVNGGEIEPVDIITFGSPCQDLSVAGKRAGLKHEANGDEETTRSGLFMEAVRIIKEMRQATNGKYPAFALWENVPGAFSSNKGEDFRIVCEELIKIVEPTASMPEVPKGGWNYADSYLGDGWSLAYRVLDAQYWGVPQRRRRIYLVADFTGQRAREVLFEREGLRGYFAEGTTPWQTTPTDAQGSSGADDPEEEDNGGARGRGLDAVGVLNAIGGNAENGQETDTNFIDVEMEVAVRKYEVNVPLLIECLRDHKAGSNFSNKDIAEQLNRPITEVEHWFRTDNCFAVPAPEIWYKLKELLGIQTDEFDQSIMTFEYKGGTYDMRNRIHVGDTAPTLTCGSGNNLHLLPTEPVICLQGNGIDRADTAGCNGKGWKEGVGYTLNTIDRPAVVYAVDQGGGKSSANVTEDKAPTLCTTHGGEPAVAYGFDPQRKAEGQGFIEEVSTCLVNGTNPGWHKGVVHAPVLHASKASYFMRATEGAADTLVATDYKDPQLIAYPAELHDFLADHNADAPHQQDQIQAADGIARPLVAGTHGAAGHHTKTVIYSHHSYIVRRLTPTECARLQGFADWWGIVEKKDALTDEEYNFWLEVRNTHAAINGKKTQEYTPKQMLTWYNKLWTDSAEYKMWGNGIALPTALYCMQGIAEALNRQEDIEEWML